MPFQKKKEGLISITEAAKIKKVTKQAIYLAVRLGRIRTYKDGRMLKVFAADLKAYDKSKFSRAVSVFEGEKIYDEDKGLVNIDKAAKLLGIEKQRVYYAVRTGLLKASKVRCAWVIDTKDLMKFKGLYFEKDFKQKRTFYRKKAS